MTAAIAAAVEARDYLRRSTAVADGPPGHKEWLHFAVYGGGVDFLVNFSLVDELGPRAPRGAELARVTCLARDHAWEGDVELWPSHSVRAPGGRLDLAFGPNRLQFVDGVYRLCVRMRRRSIEADLELTPEVFPLETNNVALAGGPPLHWVVVPRLRASGVVRVAGREYRLSNALAYHDHNWGRFTWGKTFAWEWGYVLPRDAGNPFSIAFVRLADRGRRCAWMQGVFVWRRDRQARLFRDAQVSLRHEGLLRLSDPFKLPRISNLVNPGSASDVPRRLYVSGDDDADQVQIAFDSQAVAQLVVPNDRDLGITVIHEVVGESHVRGVLHGETFEFSGRSICEFLGD